MGVLRSERWNLVRVGLVKVIEKPDEMLTSVHAMRFLPKNRLGCARDHFDGKLVWERRGTEGWLSDQWSLVGRSIQMLKKACEHECTTLSAPRVLHGNNVVVLVQRGTLF